MEPLIIGHVKLLLRISRLQQIMKKLKIFYRERNENFCPFCRDYARLPDRFMESIVCGGYGVHNSCLNELKKYQKETGILINVLAPNQEPEILFDLKEYSIVEIVDNHGGREDFLARYVKNNNL